MESPIILTKFRKAAAAIIQVKRINFKSERNYKLNLLQKLLLLGISINELPDKL